MQLESTDIYADMDPRLQAAVDRESRGMTLLATTSSDANEIGVVALVSEPSEWGALSAVRPGAALGKTSNGWIVTGRIPVDQIEAVRKESPVRSMKAAQPLHPLLSATVPEIGAGAALPPGLQSSGGAGAVAGFVDSGADFAHDHFRQPDGSTRITALWDQSGPLGGNSPFGYGRRYTAADIDAALQHDDPYAALGYEPPVDPP